MRKLINFFDTLEDKIRGWLSRHPILYTFIGGVAIVLFWRGVWHTADFFPFLTGPVSIIISVVVLLLSGLFVSFFVGDNILLSGRKREKKLAEKTNNGEAKGETKVLDEVIKGLQTLEKEVKDMREHEKEHH